MAQEDSSLEPIEHLNARLESFIRLALDSRSGLKAAEALFVEHLGDWAKGDLPGLPCWKRLDCSRLDCPSHDPRAQRCWLQVGTLCGGAVQGTIAGKLGSCYLCPVLREALADPQRALAENALILAHQIRTLSAELHGLAVRDALTGLHNRRFFDIMIPTQIREAERRGAQPWILAVDLDEFKQVNDRFGHAEGDAALVEAARILESSVRAGDIVFRVGGDEFAVLMADGSAETAAQVEERLRGAFERWNAKEGAKRGYRLTASTGSGALDPVLGLAESLALADKRMYGEKAKGKEQFPTSR
ncbi:MAG: GGDEF domain-containing protein [Planctomycetes bacterium]|nr:GGDEF domain-containing protein [Planctomycetota bacterium]